MMQGVVKIQQNRFKSSCARGDLKDGRCSKTNSCKSTEYVMTVAGTRGLPDREELN